MRVELFSTGLIDDLAGDVLAVEIVRVGDSRYSGVIHGTSNIEIELWTTRKDRIFAEPWDAQPSWVTLELGSARELVSFRASDCHFHLEHLDRQLYFVGVSRAHERWGFNLRARGYMKTRISSTTSAP